MCLNIFDEISKWLFHQFANAVDLFFDSVAACLRTFCAIFLTPIRIGSGAADIFGIPVLWTPLFLLGCAVLLVLLLGLTGWALAERKRRKR